MSSNVLDFIKNMNIYYKVDSTTVPCFLCLMSKLEIVLKTKKKTKVRDSSLFIIKSIIDNSIGIMKNNSDNNIFIDSNISLLNKYKKDIQDILDNNEQCIFCKKNNTCKEIFKNE